MGACCGRKADGSEPRVSVSNPLSSEAPVPASSRPASNRYLGNSNGQFAEMRGVTRQRSVTDEDRPSEWEAGRQRSADELAKRVAKPKSKSRGS